MSHALTAQPANGGGMRRGGAGSRRGESSSEREQLLAAMNDAATYGRSGPVRRRETHASWVFLAGRGAYKVKKPVKLAFLDYSTAELRHAACREELRVNRELAGDVYLGVRAIVPTPDGFALGREDDPRAVEYAVQMRRFEESRTLRGLIESGELQEHDLREVARTLARFHERAAPVSGAGPAQLLWRWQENLQELERLVDPATWRLHHMREFGHAFISAHTAEINQRLRAGLARDCHGDLRCEHVLLEDGVRVLDRIEFDPALRHLDVGADLAFLWMDLQASGQPQAARRLLAEYRKAGGRAGSDALICFHAAYWALVRAKVELLGCGGSARAERLRELAERLCWRARGALAVILCGPTASGKSTLAAELARRSGLPVLASDQIRKRLAGVGCDERAGAEHYSAEFTAATYRALGHAAHARLSHEEGVILDATCRTAEQRAELFGALGEVSDQLLFVHCDVSALCALERARGRMREAHRISDATPQIAAEQHRGFQPPRELPAQLTLRLDCEQPVARQADILTRTLDRRMALGARGVPTT
ncbi:MAG TPA: AAA family ATPase [Solirubrobacteraceae bacterium]|nr:AAA family ATPase [Solirubrobacteraceae bacterium]